MPDVKLIKASTRIGDRNKSKNSRLRIAAYCRVSTEEDGTRGCFQNTIASS